MFSDFLITYYHFYTLNRFPNSTRNIHYTDWYITGLNELMFNFLLLFQIIVGCFICSDFIVLMQRDPPRHQTRILIRGKNAWFFSRNCERHIFLIYTCNIDLFCFVFNIKLNELWYLFYFLDFFPCKIKNIHFCANIFYVFNCIDIL